MALGETMVDVIIKKMSSRKMRSVIDAILKAGDIFALRFSIVASPSLLIYLGSQ